MAIREIYPRIEKDSSKIICDSRATSLLLNGVHWVEINGSLKGIVNFGRSNIHNVEEAA